MKYSIALAIAAGAFVLLSSITANAQLIAETTPTPTATGQLPTDVKPTDWAYAAVQDCAAKGLIAGYPPDGNFLGGRAVTRFEMATIVARILAKLDALAQSGANTQGIQTQVGEAGQLSDEYKVELTVIGTDMTQAKADIAKLQGQVETLQQGLGSAYDALEEQAKRTDALKAQVTALGNTAYTSNPKSKFNISGYIQARAVDAASGSGSRFPQGTAAVQGAYNGNYAQGGAVGGEQVRRARLKFTGAITNNTNYAAQLDFSGMTSATSQQVTVREAWTSYTLGDGDAKVYPTISAGMFSVPFGYVLPESNASTLTPEKPLAFSDGGTFGPFNSQDYDKGLKAAYTYTPMGVSITYAAINGAGRQNENIDGQLDSVARLGYSTPSKVINAGVSYYDGSVYRVRPATGGGTPKSPGISASELIYPKPHKKLAGIDAEINLNCGAFLQTEFIKGEYEARSYFDDALSTAKSPTGGDALLTDGYLSHNQMQGYYIWGGYTFSQTGSRPLTFGIDYDVYQRSIDAHTNANNAYQGNNPGSGSFFGTGSSYDDVNVGYGVLYNLDRAIRLRLWYDDPKEVAHAAGTTDPPKIGLTTMEAQVKF